MSAHHQIQSSCDTCKDSQVIAVSLCTKKSFCSMLLNAIALHLNDQMATKEMPNPVKFALTGFSKSKEKTSSVS